MSKTMLTVEFEPILATFTDDLTAVVFTQHGHVVDPRWVLSGLVDGTFTVAFKQEVLKTQGILPRLHVASQTWEIVKK